MDFRLVNVRVESTIFVHVMRGHEMERIETDWPADAKIINCFWDGARAQVVLTIHSETFDIVPEAAMIPEWSPTITRHRSIEAELANLVRREEATT